MLISKHEVMKLLHIKSRDTLYRYERDRGFPTPVKTHPTFYVRKHVVEWIEKQSYSSSPSDSMG